MATSAPHRSWQHHRLGFLTTCGWRGLVSFASVGARMKQSKLRRRLWTDSSNAWMHWPQRAYPSNTGPIPPTPARLAPCLCEWGRDSLPEGSTQRAWSMDYLRRKGGSLPRPLAWGSHGFGSGCLGLHGHARRRFGVAECRAAWSGGFLGFIGEHARCPGRSCPSPERARPP